MEGITEKYDVVCAKIRNDRGGESRLFFELKEQAFIFQNKPGKLVNMRNITKLQENTELQSQNKMMQLFNSSCNHEMLAPIRCIIQIAETLRVKNKASFGLKVIFNTASFLLSQVM